MVAGTALAGATAPVFVFVGAALPLSPLALGLRLAGALVVRRVLGDARVRRLKEPLDGVNVVILYCSSPR